MIEAVYHDPEQAGSPRVYWQAHESNETSIRLYDQLAARSGFVVYAKAL